MPAAPGGGGGRLRPARHSPAEDPDMAGTGAPDHANPPGCCHDVLLPASNSSPKHRLLPGRQLLFLPSDAAISFQQLFDVLAENLLVTGTGSYYMSVDQVLTWLHMDSWKLRPAVQLARAHKHQHLCRGSNNNLHMTSAEVSFAMNFAFACITNLP